MTTDEIIKTISQQLGLTEKQVRMYLSIFTTGVEQHIDAKDTTPITIPFIGRISPKLNKLRNITVEADVPNHLQQLYAFLKLDRTLVVRQPKTGKDKYKDVVYVGDDYKEYTPDELSKLITE